MGLFRQLTSTVRITILEEMAYRMNFIFLFLGLPIKILVSWMLWDFVVADNLNFKGMTPDQILLYVSFTAFLSYLYDIQTGLAIMENKLIRGGAVMELTLPIDFHLKGIFSQWGTFLLYTIAGLLTMATLVFLRGIYINFNLLQISVIFILIILNSILLYEIMSIFGGLSVLLGPVMDIKGTIIQVLEFLGGSIIPIVFFPRYSHTLLLFNPFSSLLDFPAMVLLGLDFRGEFILRISIMVSWIILCTIINKLIWKVARDKFSAPGE